jgi:putative N-acetylmannosamine-6-phosphate epimerase
MRGAVDPYAVATPQTVTSAANDTAVITLAAASGVSHVLDSLQWSYDGASTTGGLTVTINAVSVFDVDIIRAAADNDSMIFPKGMYTTPKNQAMVITLKAAGAGIVGKLNAQTR